MGAGGPRFKSARPDQSTNLRHFGLSKAPRPWRAHDHVETEQFEQFIKERQYISNVRPRTVEWYRESFKWLDENQEPTQDELKSVVMRMREAGLKSVTCNNRNRALNAYLHWKSDGISKCGAGCRHFRVPKLKEDQRVLPTYDQSAIAKLMGWRPKGQAQTRLQTLVRTLADIGARIDEVLSLQWSDVDFDNLPIF